MVTMSNDNSPDESSISIDEFNNQLRETKLAGMTSLGEVKEVTPYGPDDLPKNVNYDYALEVVVQNLTDTEFTELLPAPNRWDYSNSDLVTLLEFTGLSVEETSDLPGKRLPVKEGVVWHQMRHVLQREDRQDASWSYEGRLDELDV